MKLAEKTKPLDHQQIDEKTDNAVMMRSYPMTDLTLIAAYFGMMDNLNLRRHMQENWNAQMSV